jgi:hypothetical protein
MLYKKNRRIERKLSEPNIATASSPPAPPSYEDAVRDSPMPSHEERYLVTLIFPLFS